MKQLPLLFLAQLAGSGVDVQLGKTIITGREIPELRQEFFGGIPFAKPPLGSLRFKPPIPQLSLESATFDATEYGPQCMQIRVEFPPIPSLPLSEDCLTLNIERPAGVSTKDKLPVMVWIYGGGFTIGSGPQYNGSTIVSQSVSRGTPIIHVSFNYRLGAFGFPQGEEAVREGALNLGIKDQLAALEWVHANIGTFGGDPTKVTVFGESAGAISISIMYFNPRISRLIRGAILHSGTAGLLTFPPQRRRKVWPEVVGFVPECASLALTGHTFDCLRNVSADTVLEAQDKQSVRTSDQFPWGPAIDGHGGLIPDYPSKLFKAGRFAKIPFIAGANLDEGTLFSTQAINSSDTIREWIVSNHTVTPADIPKLKHFADRILQLYPDNPALGSPFRTGNETFDLSRQYKRLAAIVGDLMFHSHRRNWMQAATEHGVKAFGYLFTDPVPPALANPSLGVYHAMELFDFYPEVFPGVQLDEGGRKLSEQMIHYWVSFATSLDPNDNKGSDRLKWPRYTPQNQVLLELNRENSTTIPDDYREKQINYINEHAVLLGH